MRWRFTVIPQLQPIAEIILSLAPPKLSVAGSARGRDKNFFSQFRAPVCWKPKVETRESLKRETRELREEGRERGSWLRSIEIVMGKRRRVLI